MKEGKYIVFDNGECMVFDRTEIHAWMAKKVHSHPVSAGFFEIEPGGKVTPFGYSMTLDLRSKPSDAWLIKRELAKAV